MTSLETAALDLFAESQLRGRATTTVASTSLAADGTDLERLRAYVAAYNLFPHQERCFEFRVLTSAHMAPREFCLSIHRH